MNVRETTEGFLLPPVPVTSLDDYRARGGLRGLVRALELGPAATIAEVDRAGLRGRGGAGFPTGRKWASIRGAPGHTKFVAVNAAEGEPGTFKDRALLRANPYQLLEGLAIAIVAVGAAQGFVAIKRTFTPEIAGLTQAVDEMRERGLFGDVAIHIITGPDEYLFGEEKALLEVIEGNPPLPRQLPPYQHGLFATDVQLGWQAHDSEDGLATSGEANPTLVNNVETLANVPHILANGPEWFRGSGTDMSPGVLLVTIVGDVMHADVGQVEMGVTLADAIEAVGGGVAPGRSIKAVFSGVSNPVMTPVALDTPLTYEDFAAAGTGLGAAGFIVYDNTTCMVEVSALFSRFLSIESCGQCPACKLGSATITERLTAIDDGLGGDADIEVIAGRLRGVTDGNRCALPIEEQNVVGSLLTTFPEEFAAHIESNSCPMYRRLIMPKLVDIVDGRAVYDARYVLKQPDWTYTEGVTPQA